MCRLGFFLYSEGIRYNKQDKLQWCNRYFCMMLNGLMTIWLSTYAFSQLLDIKVISIFSGSVMKLPSLNNMAIHVRTEQNSPSLFKSLAKLSFNFLMNRHNNIQYDFKSIDIVRKQQHRDPTDNTKYTSAALLGCY